MRTAGEVWVRGIGGQERDGAITSGETRWRQGGSIGRREPGVLHHCSLFFSLLHERFVRKRTHSFTLYILMFKFYHVYGIVNKKILVHNY